MSTSAGGASGVARDGGGNSIVAWSAANGANGTDIFVQRFDAAGAAVGTPILANVITAGDQKDPAIASDSAGNFTVAWRTGSSAKARTFDAVGAPRSGEISVGSVPLNFAPKIASVESGGFVSAWVQSSTIILKGYDANGVEKWSRIPSQNAYGVDVAVASDGRVALGYVAVDGYKIQRYSATGATVGNLIPVVPDNMQWLANVTDLAIDNAGNMCVAYLEPTSGTGSRSIYIRRVNASGQLVGSSPTYCGGDYVTTAPQVVLDNAGNAVIVYKSDHGGSSPSKPPSVFMLNMTPANVGAGYLAVAGWDDDGVAASAPALGIGADGGLSVVASRGTSTSPPINEYRFQTFANPAVIRGRAWRDGNDDGIRQSNEPGYQDIPVRLRTSLGRHAGANRTTGTTGTYEFANVIPGQSVYVEADIPTAYALAHAHVGSNPAVDSDINESTGQSDLITLSAGQTQNDLDIGVAPLVKYHGLVWADYNGNGLRDRLEANISNEPGLIDWTAYADLNQNGTRDASEPSATTASGEFEIYLRRGTYRFNVESQSGWSAPAAVVSDGSGLLGFGVKPQRAAVAPQTVGSPITVTTTTAEHPSVGLDASGAYVVTWAASSRDGSGKGVYARRYDASGNALGADVRVNTTTIGDQSNPVIAVAPSGAFTIAWQSGTSGVFMQRYSQSGAPLGAETQVDSPGMQGSDPTIAVDTDGELLVGWLTRGGVASAPGDVYFIRFAADGTALGPAQLITGTSAADETDPVVAYGPNGTFAAAWSSKPLDSSDVYSVYVRRFDADASAIGAARRVTAASSTTDHRRADLAVGPDGRMVVTSQAPGIVEANRLEANGDVVGGVFFRRGYAYTNSSTTSSGVSMNAAGDFAIGAIDLASAQAAATLFSADGALAEDHLSFPGSDYSQSQIFGVATAMNADGKLVLALSTSRNGAVTVQRYAAAGYAGLLGVTYNVVSAADASVSLMFSEDIVGFDAADVVITNTSTGQTLASGDYSLDYDSASHVATITIAGGAPLVSGVYTIAWDAAAAHGSVGSTLAKSDSIQLILVNGTSNDDAINVVRDYGFGATDELYKVFVNVPTSGTPTFQATMSAFDQCMIFGGAGDDTFTTNATYGSALLQTRMNGPIFDGGAGNDRIVALADDSIGSDFLARGNEVGVYYFNYEDRVMTFVLATYENVESVHFAGGYERDSLTIYSPDVSPSFEGAGGDSNSLEVFEGEYVFTNDFATNTTSPYVVVRRNGSVRFEASQHLTYLAFDSGGRASVASGAGLMINTQWIWMPGTARLDLADNDLRVTGASKSEIESLVRTAYNDGGWDGPGGIFSSAAKDNPAGNTTLGILSGQEFNDNNGGTFNGQAVNGFDVLVRYTYFGDVDFNGSVDVSDYNLIDFGFANHLTGWAFGDVDYSNSPTDVSDYNLIDFAFATQTGIL